MLTNKQRALIDKNRDFIDFLTRLEENGIDVWAMVDIGETLIKLHNRSKQANFDLVALTTFIVEQRSAESANSGRSEASA